MTRHSGAAFTLEHLPLFASDAEVGAALLGTKRASEWRALVALYERQGFPKIDPVMGGRYVPAIKAFFDKQYGIATLVLLHQMVSTGQKHGKQHQAKNAGLKISATKERSRPTVLDRIADSR